MSESYKRNPNTACKVCGKQIYRRPCEIKENDRRVFCSSLCYGVANRIEKPCKVCGKPIQSRFNKKTCSRACSNINRAGIKYGQHRPFDKVFSERIIKIRLLKMRGTKCERCGYAKTEILQVHHKDRNHKNNNIENLELICPNCHYEDHYLKGSWLSEEKRRVAPNG